MEMVTAGFSLPFEVTWDSAVLNVGMTVWDVTDPAHPTNANNGPVVMPLLHGFTYFGKFTPAQNHAYIIEKAVYTDNTLTVEDTNYRAGTESIFAEESANAPGITESIVGVLVESDPITGIVKNQ